MVVDLLRLGAIYCKVKNWGVYTVKDDLLITGQNPASSGPAAEVLATGTYFATETARILGGAGGALTPEQGMAVLARQEVPA